MNVFQQHAQQQKNIGPIKKERLSMDHAQQQQHNAMSTDHSLANLQFLNNRSSNETSMNNNFFDISFSPSTLNEAENLN